MYFLCAWSVTISSTIHYGIKLKFQWSFKPFLRFSYKEIMQWKLLQIQHLASTETIISYYRSQKYRSFYQENDLCHDDLEFSERDYDKSKNNRESC